MNRHRGACMDPGDDKVWGLKQRPDPQSHDHLHRWEPWVRSYLCAQALTSDLSFVVLGDVNGRAPETLQDGQASKFNVTLFAGLPGQAKPMPLVRLVRPTQEAFERQVASVLTWADLREERLPEVLTQIGNCFAFWGALVPLHAERLRYTREVLDAAVQFAMFVEMRFKHELACWRPADLSPQVQPMVTTPGHGSLPSGHCTEAFVIKEVLEALLGMDLAQDDPNLHRQFERTAARIATNRVVAGVHFPIDNLAGRLLGTVLGRYFVFRSKGMLSNGAPWTSEFRTFHGDRCNGLEEFDPDRQDLNMTDPQEIGRAHV